MRSVAGDRMAGKRSSVLRDVESRQFTRPGRRTALSAIRGALGLPLYALARSSPAWPLVERDIKRYVQPRMDLPLPEDVALAPALAALGHRPVRSILFVRLAAAGGIWRVLARALPVLYYRGAVALEIHCPEIGGGMCSYHGFATIIIAERIGEDCLFAQQVTVGYDDRGGCPTIGARVRIGAGAIVLGPITVGDDAVIGAGAVVVRDVPPGVVVGGVPARVIENAADRFGARRSA
jgi:serine O-acetyltransferase